MESGREQEQAAFNAWKYREVQTLFWVWLGQKWQKHSRPLYTLCGKKTSVYSEKFHIKSEHLASRHSNVKLVERPPDSSSPTGAAAPATTSDSTGRTANGPSAAKQVKIDVRATGLSAAELKKLVADYIVEDMSLISTVDSVSFRRIVEKIPTKSDVKLFNNLVQVRESCITFAWHDVHKVKTENNKTSLKIDCFIYLLSFNFVWWSMQKE